VIVTTVILYTQTTSENNMTRSTQLQKRMEELTEALEIAIQEGNQGEAEELYMEVEELSREIEESF